MILKQKSNTLEHQDTYKVAPNSKEKQHYRASEPTSSFEQERQ